MISTGYVCVCVCVSQVLLDVTALEFVTFMRILTGLPSMNTLVGRQQLVDIVAEQADLNSAFNVYVLTIFISLHFALGMRITKQNILLLRLSVCLSVSHCIPILLHGPKCNCCKW